MALALKPALPESWYSLHTFRAALFLWEHRPPLVFSLAHRVSGAVPLVNHRDGKDTSVGQRTIPQCTSTSPGQLD